LAKLKASTVVKSALSRAVHPGHLWRAAQLQRHRKRDSRSHDDVQLKLYSEMLPSDFLHYGYFDDVNRAPEDMSLNEIVVAQNRYADLDPRSGPRQRFRNSPTSAAAWEASAA